MPDRDNFVMVRGNVVAEPESRTFGGNKIVAKCRMAVNRRRKGPDGSWQEDTSYFDVSGFEPQAQAILALAKGQKVTVIGTLRQRTWADKQTGAKRSAVEIMADAIATEIKLVANSPQPTFEQLTGEVEEEGW